ncbi:hypothetical protein BDV93DRAFT_518227 [Ceratobasidium sp. AG-I]|nr:hypothetical protein BDV93DRAFT_518227 [Ceratobasidium sp. AG-I]
MDHTANRKSLSRSSIRWLCGSFVLISIIILGKEAVSLLRATPQYVECVPYGGGTTVTSIPVLYPEPLVLLHPSVSSGDVSVTRVDKFAKEVTLTLEGETVDKDAGIRLCTLKEGKFTGLSIFVGKGRGRPALPIVKSLRIEIPNSIPSPDINLISRSEESNGAKFFKWASNWIVTNPQGTKIRVEDAFE